MAVVGHVVGHKVDVLGLALRIDVVVELARIGAAVAGQYQPVKGKKANAERGRAKEDRAEQAPTADLRKRQQPDAATASLAPSGLPIH